MLLTKELLKSTQLGKHLSTDCIDALYPILSRNSFSKTFNSGESVLRRGDPHEHLMIIKDGLIKAYNFTIRGEQIFFYYFSRHQIAGLVGCINHDLSRSDNVAERATTVIFVPREDYLSACRLIPEFQTEVLNLVCKNANRQIEISILSRCKYAKDRLCLWLYHQYTYTRATNIPIEFTITSLANFLGLTRACLSKELHGLETEGIIELSRKEILIRDLKKLEQYV